ncbi:hypothetical protein F383_37258 [Gossypium arboreum]|uniref:Uncharacterized protein n=1 Tax=Gossypium arboreum TaxID=29729 RepID=A0A0B0MCS8_GOSAR|nr:hypothetical protein F383_37258 [Gossypium arboreum]
MVPGAGLVRPTGG